jgi:ADP-ribose pyrophosphatase
MCAAPKEPTQKVTLYEGKYKRLVREGDWEFIERVNCWGIVGILAMTDDKKVILVEQYRVPVGNRAIEFPAGLADGAGGSHGETLEETAHRELLEETGYQAERMIYCTEGPISSASNADIMVLYLAQGLKKVAPGGGDHLESITVHEVPLGEIDEWLGKKEKEGILVDSKIYAGLYLLTRILQ